MTVDGSDLAGLARRAAGGERDALEELIATLQPDVVRTARLIVGPGSSAAEDAAQDALLDVARAIRSLRDVAAVRAWALRIATRRALRTARKERILRLGRASTPVGLPAADPPDGRTVELKLAFYRLPAALRAVAVLRLHAGLSEAETAAVLRVPVGTVKSKLHAARRELGAFLRDAGLEPTTRFERSTPKRENR